MFNKTPLIEYETTAKFCTQNATTDKYRIKYHANIKPTWLLTMKQQQNLVNICFKPGYFQQAHPYTVF